MIHTVKGFGVVNKAELVVFLELSCIFYDPADVGNLSLVPLPFLNPAWTSGSSWFTYCWSLAWRILSITFLACEMSAIVWEFEHSLALPFFGTGMKTDLFQSCGHCWVFQICGHIECRTFTASSFRIWNSSTGIPARPLALFIALFHFSACHMRMACATAQHAFYIWEIIMKIRLHAATPMMENHLIWLKKKNRFI